MKNKFKKGFTITRSVCFNGRRKVGIDTNILRRLYDQPYLLGREASRIFNFNDLIFSHVICLYEFVRYLKKRENLSKEKAKIKAKEFFKKNNVRLIYPKNCFVSEQESRSFEEEVNKKLKEEGKDYLDCHSPDSVILLAFKKWGINKIYSTDEAFRIGAQHLGMDGSGLPSFDKLLRDKLRKDKRFSKR